MASVISYPPGGDYRDALYNTNLCFRDPALIGGMPAMDPFGMPKAISGNFASVFKIQGVDGRRWAVKCFTRYVEDQAVRYQQISKTLEAVTNPWKVGFEYLHEGVLCRGKWYPALKMEWIEATGLLPYIESHLSEQSALADLAVKFEHLVQDLARYGIAHGDLQHGNILVTPSRELKLIDYDGMFVPGLDGLGASELGHANYQSPLRTVANWGPDIDRFSSWVIYASLTALALDPTLWAHLHAEGDEALLFHKSDFDDPDGSRILFALANSSIPELQKIAKDIDFLWAADLRAVPSLGTIVAPTAEQTVVNATAAVPIPDWLRQNQATPLSAEAGATGTAAWLTGHLPLAPSISFTSPSAFTRITAAILLGCVVTLSVFSGAGIILAPVGSFFAFLFAVAFWISSSISYYRSSVHRSMRKSRRLFRKRQAESAKAARAVSELERGIAKLERDADRDRSAVEKKANKARSGERKELDSISKNLNSRIASLERQINSLQKQENAAIEKALSVLRAMHIEQTLSGARISSARIRGIGTTLTSTLAAYGISSAADFTGIGTMSNGRGGQQTYLILRNGARVSPKGIGHAKAVALNSWRYGIESGARASQPVVLPANQVSAIKARYGQQRQSLVNDQHAARAKAATEQDTVRQKWAKTHADIAKELGDVSRRPADLRAAKMPQLTAARQKAGTADWQRDFAKRELDRYRKVHYRQYLWKLISG